MINSIETIIWEFAEDRTWKPIHPCVAIELEKLFQNNFLGTSSFTNPEVFSVQFSPYEVQFGELLMRNKLNNCVVPIRRRLVIPLHIEAPYPIYWTKNTNSLLCEVTKDSEEWKIIELKVKSSSLTTEIVMIQRVQNTFLYTQYQNFKAMLAEKNQGIVNELMLFHGSERVQEIIQGKTGFDPNKSRNGNYGYGCYFSTKFSYSKAYAKNTNQMLLCRVAVGWWFNIPENFQARSLRKAPERLQFDVLCNQWKKAACDSVTAVSMARMFVVYDLYQSYPEYLITFAG